MAVIGVIRGLTSKNADGAHAPTKAGNNLDGGKRCAAAILADEFQVEAAIRSRSLVGEHFDIGNCSAAGGII